MKFLSDKRVIFDSRILTLESKMIVPGLSEFVTRRKQVDKNLSAYVAHRSINNDRHIGEVFRRILYRQQQQQC